MKDSMKELKCLPFLCAVLLLRFLLTAYCRKSSTANFSCVLILYVTKTSDDVSFEFQSQSG